jgi:hypothetical protein
MIIAIIGCLLIGIGTQNFLIALGVFFVAFSIVQGCNS